MGTMAHSEFTKIYSVEEIMDITSVERCDLYKMKNI